MNLKNGKVFTSKFVGTGPSSYEKRIYRASASQRLRNTVLDYMTTAQYGGKVVSPTHRPPLPPGNTPGSHFC